MKFIILAERDGKTVTVSADDAYEAEAEVGKLASKGYAILDVQSIGEPDE